MYKKTIPTKLFIQYFVRTCARQVFYRNGKNPGEEIKGPGYYYYCPRAEAKKKIAAPEGLIEKILALTPKSS